MSDRYWGPIKETNYQRRKDRLPRILSEGDSWFDYPLYSNVIDFIDDKQQYAIKRLEKSGDKLSDIIVRIGEFQATVEEEEPCAVLLSAGGNDLVEDDWIDTLFTEEAPYIATEVWEAKLNDFRAGYTALIEAVKPPVPVIGHGYDYIVPSGEGVRLDGLTITGPWIKTAMECKGITNEGRQRRLAKTIIDDFNETLRGLASEQPRFHLVDLRGTLDPENDWANEMHPLKVGFELISIKVSRELGNQLGRS